MQRPAPSIATKRLSLRPFRVVDAIDLFSIRGDGQAMRFWDWPADETMEQTRDLARQIELEVAAGVAFYWTAHARSGEFIGVFDLSALACTSADLGFMVARRHWGQGYATEATGALIEEARRRGLAHLHARIHTGNDASHRLLNKLGFHTLRPDEMFEVVPGRSILCAFYWLDLAIHDRGPS